MESLYYIVIKFMPLHTQVFSIMLMQNSICCHIITRHNTAGHYECKQGDAIKVINAAA